MNEVVELCFKTFGRLLEIAREGVEKALKIGFIREEKISKYYKRRLKRRNCHESNRKN